MNTVFVTGAGISEPSGIPTYRNGGAGWDNKRLEEISHYTRYGNHLDELWEFWEKIFNTVQNAEPNEAHFALAKSGAVILTQNIDGLHNKAGGEGALGLHGNIRISKCLRCKGSGLTRAVISSGRKCFGCGSNRVRPAITLFGEPLRREAKEALTKAKFADTVVFVGTSGNVWPVSALPDRVKAMGGRTVLINKEPWGNFDEVILGDVGDTVPEFVERLENEN